MSIKPYDFFQYLSKNKINFFTGVPDSLLKQFCLCVDHNVEKNKHIIAANEGNAISLGAGYHLATGKLPLVYMQNSGFGNAINPLLSLCDQDVYSIPMLLLIGWRGEPGLQDEPQHIKQGKIQVELLNTLGIPYEIISKDETLLESKLINCVKKAINENTPVALLVKKGTFEKYDFREPEINNTLMSREEALNILLNEVPENSIIVSTTGKTSREIFEIREKNNNSHEKDFLTVGSMGHCSSIALGIAISKPNRKIICIDGDGSLLMHMGSLSMIGKLKPKNFYHILMNNQVHESVGGQETSARFINILDIIKANNYDKTFFINTKQDLINKINNMFLIKGSVFTEIFIKPGSRKSLGRPTISPKDNKKAFMNFIKIK